MALLLYFVRSSRALPSLVPSASEGENAAKDVSLQEAGSFSGYYKPRYKIHGDRESFLGSIRGLEEQGLTWKLWATPPNRAHDRV